MVIQYGVIIFFGFIFLGMKVPKWLLLRLLGYSLIIDIGITVLAYVMHYGTMTGVMAAAAAGMMMSIATAVLPVCRSPMISSHCPRPMGIIASMALMPV